MTINFGYSPCPNDTYMFWAWVHGRVAGSLGIEPHLADIQELNAVALGSESLPLTKVSVATYLDSRVQERYRLLSVGAALGRGCGPLVVSKKPWSLEHPTPLRVAIPGRNTTAFRLAQEALGPWVKEWVELRYDQIMPAVDSEDGVDAGVIIHESRFVYQKLGLVLALDLGEWWETKTGLPLPLGVMVAHNDLPEEQVQTIEAALKESIALAHKTIDGAPDDPATTSLWSYLRDNAIELDDTTIRSHIELYVNEFSSDLGQTGREAIEAMGELSGSGV